MIFTKENTKLHDFLLMMLGEDALILVETPDLESRGFERRGACLSKGITQAVGSTSWTR